MPLPSLARVLPGVAALFVSACAERGTATDRERLAQVRVDFASEFLLEPSTDIYVAARHLKVGCPSRERAEALYRAFWQDEPAGVRNDSAFVYLNLNDDEGRFCFQLFWDAQTGHLEHSDQAHY